MASAPSNYSTTQSLTSTHPPLEPVEARQIFINDISGDTTTSDLRNLFAGAGKVTNVEIDTNELNRHFAFVTFESSQGVQQAITKFTTTNLNNTTLVCRRRTELEQMRQKRMIEARCKLFVGNIPQQMPPQDLRREIERLSQRPIADFRHKKGYCFVGYNTPQDAEDAKRNLKNAMCGGKSLNAEFKKEDPIRNEPGFIAVLEQAQRTLYVRDIPPNSSPESFKTAFEQYGKVRKFTLPTENRSNKLVGYAFIEYFWKEDCDKALLQTEALLIDGVQIEIRISDPPKDKQSKGSGDHDGHRRGGGSNRRDRRDNNRGMSRDRRDNRSSRDGGRRNSRFNRNNRSRSRSRSRSRDRGSRYQPSNGHHSYPPTPYNTANIYGQPALPPNPYNTPNRYNPIPQPPAYATGPPPATVYNQRAVAATYNPYATPNTAAAATPTVNTTANTANTAAATATTTAPITPTYPPNPYGYNYNAYAYPPYGGIPQHQPPQPPQATATPQQQATNNANATNTATTQQQQQQASNTANVTTQNQAQQAVQSQPHPQYTQQTPYGYPPQPQQPQTATTNGAAAATQANNTGNTAQTTNNVPQQTAVQTANNPAATAAYNYYNTVQPNAYAASYYQQQAAVSAAKQQQQQQQPPQTQQQYAYPQQTNYPYTANRY